jgi:hypothetical protein
MNQSVGERLQAQHDVIRAQFDLTRAQAQCVRVVAPSVPSINTTTQFQVSQAEQNLKIAQQALNK